MRAAARTPAGRVRDERVFILGAGRAGRGLARAFRAAHVEVLGLHGRHHPGGRDRVTVGDLPGVLARATVVLIAVRDEQLDGALAELLRVPLASGAVVLHTSGGIHPSALDEVRARGHPAGTFHPLVPLADPGRGPALLRGAWIGVDGDEEALAMARALATRLGARALAIPPGAKARYHAAAVFASNFPVVLLALSERLLQESGIRPDVARDAARSLLVAAVDNLRSERAPDALTGPVVRGDVTTIRRHREALASAPDLLAVYDSLTRAAVRLARVRGGSEGPLRAIEELVLEPQRFDRG